MSQIINCQNCRFSCADSQSEFQCRRNAPLAMFPGTTNMQKNVEEQQRAFWPRVYYLDWCGEYEPKK